MTTCANCQSEALYTYAVTEQYLIHYCQLHLPRFLLSQKQAGQLPLRPTTPVVEEVPVVEPEVVTATESEPSATVEEVLAAEPVAETTSSKKTTTSKK
jgi:hypothetical protein